MSTRHASASVLRGVHVLRPRLLLQLQVQQTQPQPEPGAGDSRDHFQGEVDLGHRLETGAGQAPSHLIPTPSDHQCPSGYLASSLPFTEREAQPHKGDSCASALPELLRPPSGHPLPSDHPLPSSLQLPVLLPTCQVQQSPSTVSPRMLPDPEPGAGVHRAGVDVEEEVPKALL